MPSHADRVRTAPLPAGYQFGDAAGRRPILMCSCADLLTCEHPWPQMVTVPPERWRAPHLNAAERLARRGWNVIEGEHFDSDEERHRTIEGVES